MMPPEPITASIPLHNAVKMPVLGLGTWQVEEGQAVEDSVKWALELGYRHIDTAAFYGNERGIGKAIAASGIPREQIFVTTKLWNADQRRGPDAIREAFAISLDKLGMSYVDLYLIHWPVEGHYVEAWRILEELYANKRTRAIGVSNFLVPHLRNVLAAANVKPMVNQVEFHPRLLQPELMAYHREQGIVQEGWSPLMQGKVFDIPALQTLAKKHGRTVSQVVLRWNLQHGVIVIPRSIKRHRIEENSRLFDFELAPEDMQQIDGLDRTERVGPDPMKVDF